MGKEIIDAEFRVVRPADAPPEPEKPHWLFITWPEMNRADRIAYVISWACAVAVAPYWAWKLFKFIFG